ncbi:hypothetical protein [Raoultella terrigena]|uniref:hypothetical protein n=1 Tax=Raoultella terrigena TaxID=577 RepID=UPI0011D19AAA|nr:hypothetical protein [Raoultella terrigena]
MQLQSHTKPDECSRHLLYDGWYKKMEEMFMPRRRRGWRQHLFEWFAITATMILALLLNFASENSPTIHALFFGSFFIIIGICSNIVKSGKAKRYKEIFNTIWNYETALAFIYSLYSFMAHLKDEKPIIQVMNQLLESSPYIIYSGIAILTITVSFRFGLGLAELLIKTTPPKENEQ